MSEFNDMYTPRQKRSEATLASLLAATIAALDEDGLDGATIPRIAARAGVAPASVYRRFVNKDALIRAALLAMLKNSRSEAFVAGTGETLPGAARRLMTLLFRQYRQHPRLLRALTRFMDADGDTAFVAEARAIVAGNLELLAEPLLRFGDEIGHEDARAALRFALLQALTCIEAIVLEPYSLWHTAVAATDEELAEQFAQAFVAYLIGHRSAKL